MVSSRRFAVRLAVRLTWLVLAIAIAAALLNFGHAPTAVVLALLAAGAAAVGLWRLVNEGNAELSRFVIALERTDLGQSFRREGRGAGFDRLGHAYERALDRLRTERSLGARATRAAEALVDGAPTPLLVIGPHDDVRFANKAARTLFGRAHPTTIDALLPFGHPFVAALRASRPGPTALAHLIVDGLSQRIALDTTRTDIDGRTQRIVAIKIIQAELDGAELGAQIDLVRVLTHEVMNSLTPVTSLAESASKLIGGVDAAAAPGLADAQLAVAALARRAAELERFVTSYKGFSEAPVLHRRPIAVTGWFALLADLFGSTPAAQGVALSWSAAEPAMAIDGDEALLTQVMLNVLKNAGEAIEGVEQPTIDVSAAAAHDGRVKILVADNGAGIPEAFAREVFLPFYTTKPEGTGIGLSFARQIVMLHGGQIGIAAHTRGCIELLLPAMPEPRIGGED